MQVCRWYVMTFILKHFAILNEIKWAIAFDVHFLRVRIGEFISE